MTANQTSTPDNTATLGPSRFAMWRAIVAMCHADGVVRMEERNYIKRFYEIVPFSDDQRRTLEAELETPVPIEDILPDVTDAHDRAELLFFARMLFWSDGDFDEQENRIFEIIRNDALNRKDLDQSAEIATNANRDKELRALDAARRTGGVRPILGQLVQRMHGISVEDGIGPVGEANKDG